MRPMLAAKIKDLSQVRYPVLASPKLDGIRCLIVRGRAVTRALKPIPNKHVREWLETFCPSGWDGELMLPAPATFQDITSCFMSQSAVPPKDWYFAVFDRQPLPDARDRDAASSSRTGGRCVVVCVDARVRARHLQEAFDTHTTIAGGHMRAHVQLVPQKELQSEEDVRWYEEICLRHGFEGVMLRDPESPYKFGRATANEGYLFKLKRFEDSEAEVLGAVELEHNTNAAETNELGLTKRSSAKAGQRAAGVLGALKVRDVHSGVEFEIGTGFTQAQRVQFWRNRSTLIGQFAKYKYFPVGVKDKPRHPVWLGWRSLEDMS